MTYRDAVYKINSLLRFGMKPGLERIQALLDRMGNPQKQLKFVHVAGTNGKGSACALLSSVLREAGYRTGLFISRIFERGSRSTGKRFPRKRWRVFLAV